jgi:peptidoglycan L-alanyl-D-glutamate endopeptidase CwlK
MSWILDKASYEKLRGVHPDLVRVVEKAAAICDQPFVVFEGARSVERERSLIAKGFSKLKNPFRCRHVPTKDAKYGLVSHAVDLVPVVNGKPQWLWPQIYPIARAMKAAATQEHVVVEWGGDWKTIKDGSHYQLPWNLYP